MLGKVLHAIPKKIAIYTEVLALIVQNGIKLGKKPD